MAAYPYHHAPSSLRCFGAIVEDHLPRLRKRRYSCRREFDGKDQAQRPLTEADKIAAFKACTGALPKWYANEIAAGMTDAQLAKALEQAIGILGGSSAQRGRPAVAYKGAGLKIWAGWDWPDMHRQKPLFAGAATIALARQVYHIPDPDDEQMSLF
jgi:hypothetical protein